MNNWYYLVGEDQFGPVSRNVLKTALQTGELSAQTFVYRDGFQDWVPAHRCEELGVAWPPAPADVNWTEDRLPPESSSPLEPLSLWWPRSWICGGTLMTGLIGLFFHLAQKSFLTATLTVAAGYTLFLLLRKKLLFPQRFRWVVAPHLTFLQRCQADPSFFRRILLSAAVGFCLAGAWAGWKAYVAKAIRAEFYQEASAQVAEIERLTGASYQKQLATEGFVRGLFGDLDGVFHRDREEREKLRDHADAVELAKHRYALVNQYYERVLLLQKAGWGLALLAALLGMGFKQLVAHLQRSLEQARSQAHLP